MLTGAKFINLVVKPTQADTVSEGGCTTSKHRLDFTDKTLRSCVQNGLVLSVLFRSDDNNYRLTVIVEECADPTCRFQGWQSITFRDCTNAAAEFANMINGGYMKHVVDTVSGIRNEKALTRCCFALSVAGGELDDVFIAEEDYFADQFGSLAFSLGFARIRRALYYLVGFPHRLVAGLCSAAVAAKVVAEFRSAIADLKSYKDFDGNVTEDEKNIGRSPLQLTPCRAYLLGVRLHAVCGLTMWRTQFGDITLR